MKRFLILFLVIGIVLITGSYLWAVGFLVYDHDAKAQGQAGAFIAQADNPSAVYYNPAGMSQLDGVQASLGANFIRLETEYENSAGIEEDLQAEWAVVPNAYITGDLGTEKWTVGLGIYVPFGLSTSWKDTGLLRYTATDSSFNMVAINPAVAYQLLPELSVAAGVDYYNVYSNTSELKYNYILADAELKLDIDGDGWGFNLGGLWKPHPQHSIGLCYRSRVDLNLSGDYKIKSIPAGLGYPSSISYNASTDLTLPSIVSAGYAFKPVEKLKLEFDVYWVEWSTVDKAVVKDDDTGAVLSSDEKDWDDTFIFAIGGEYLVNEQWAVRAGYGYVQETVPESTFNPNLPDSSVHMITLGLGYTIDRLTVDLAYQLGLFEERDIDNNIGAALGTTVDGTYDSLSHNIGITLGYKF